MPKLHGERTIYYPLDCLKPLFLSPIIFHPRVTPKICQFPDSIEAKLRLSFASANRIISLDKAFREFEGFFSGLCLEEAAMI
jgi:hypothetical protein